MADRLWPIEFGREQFTDLERRQNSEFVCRRVERIPERLEEVAAFLGQRFLRPNRFVQFAFLCFQCGELSDDFATDQAGQIRGIGGRRRRAFARDNQRRCAAQQDDKQDREDSVEGAAHAGGA